MGIVTETLIDQTLQTSAKFWGRTTSDVKVGQTFLCPYGCDIINIKVQIAKSGNPLDNVQMKLYESDKTTLVASADSVVAGSTIPSPPFPVTPITFTFTSISLERNKEYFIEVSRSGGVDVSHYYWVGFNTDIQYTGFAFVYNFTTSEWEQQTNEWAFEVDINLEESLITTPGYLIDLLEPQTITEDIITQTVSNLPTTLGTTTIEKLGQTFTVPVAISLTKVTLKLAKFNNPIDSLQMKILASDKTTVIAEAENTILGSTLNAHSAFSIVDFTFSNVLLSDSTTYFIEVSRTGALHATNNYVLHRNTTNPYPNGSSWFYAASAWSQNATTDFYFVVEGSYVFGEASYDISCDVKNITNIDIGMSGVYGNIKQGQGLLTLDNSTAKYSPLNTSSPLYEKFRVSNKLRIRAVYNMIVYKLFTGIIENIEPSLNFSPPIVDIKLLDLFSKFAGLKVSIGTQTSKTASELIVLLLQAAGLSSTAYEVEDDLEVLRDVTWNGVTLASKLNEIIAAGQHYHYIDGDGKYIFRNNQFLSSTDPDFDYDEDDLDSGELEFNLVDISNIIDVEYTGSLFEQRSDSDSIQNFGNRLHTLGNELIVDNVYAGFIADYILSLRKDAGNILEFDLSLTYPDIFKSKFGDVVHMTDTFHSIDNVYNILEKQLKLLHTGRSIMSAKCRKFVFPPTSGTEILEPFQDDVKIILSSSIKQFLQGFKIVNNGSLTKWDYKIDIVVVLLIRFNLFIYELDGSGFPTGSELARSNPISLTPQSFSGTINFEFPTDQRPALVNTKTYGAIVDLTNDVGRFNTVKVAGKNTDVYVNGKPAQETTGWITLHPKDFYFKATIKKA